MVNVIEIVVKAKDEAKKVLADTKKESEGLGATMTKMGMVSGLALAGVAVEAVKMATSYESATTRLVTSAGESQAGLKTVSAGMLNMAQSTSTGAIDLAKGMYTVESAGYHASDGLTVLKAAAQGAKAEQADLGTVANAVTDVLTDYHLKASDAANVTSQMITAVSHGKTSFEDFSGSMHNILPLAAAMHLSFADVSGVLAEMTSHGVSADQASQNMANAMRSLLAPTHTMQTEFKAVGTSADEVHQKLSTVGLAGTLEFLAEKAKAVSPNLLDQEAAMRKLIGTAPGLQVALMTTGENAADTAAAIKDIGSASADASGNVKGFAEYQNTLRGQTDQLKASFDDLMIKLGDKLIPVIKDVVGWMDKHHTVMLDLLGAAAGAAAAFATFTLYTKAAALATAATAAAQKLLVIAEGESTVATEALGAAMSALPFVVVLAGFAAMGNEATNAVPPINKAGEAVSGLGKEIQDAANGSAPALQTLTGNIDKLMSQSRGSGQVAQGFKDMDTALAQMVSSGSTTQAAAGAKILTDELTKQGTSLGYIHDQVLPKYNAALAGAATASQDAAGQTDNLTAAQTALQTANQDVADTLGQATSAYDAAKKSAQGYLDEVDALFGKFGNLSDAQAAFTIAMDDATKKITAGKDAVDLSTVAGANNFQTFHKMAQAAEDVSSKMMETGSSADDATASLRASAGQIDALAAKSDLTTGQIKQLNTELFGIPDIKEITVTANTDPAAIALAGLQSQMDRLGAGVVGKGGNAAMFRATGGEIGAAATGGARGGLVMVGEQGPEMVRLPYGSTVRSNPDTMAALAGAQAGPGHLQVEWVGPPNLDGLMGLIKGWIRFKYGTGPDAVTRALSQSY